MHTREALEADSGCRLFSIHKFLDIVLEAVKADPKRFFKIYQD